MSWPLIFIPDEDLPFKARPPIGACWYDEHWLKWREAIAPNYLKHNASRRRPIVVQLPTGAWCVDLRARNQERGWYGDGWEVVGDLPNITVTPSIHLPGLYHGYITSGEITADIDGRRYP